MKADSLSSRDLIGIELRFEKYTEAHEQVYLVDSVQPSSPAALASLGTGEGFDYIIGAKDSPKFENSSQLSDFLYRNKDCILLVYNTSSGTVREVEIKPDPKWGGDGIIGC